MKPIYNKVLLGIISAFIFSSSFAAKTEEKTDVNLQLKSKSANVQVKREKVELIYGQFGFIRYNFDKDFLVSIVKPGGATSKFFYDHNGVLVKILTSKGFMQTPVFDKFGNLNALISTSGRKLKISQTDVDGKKKAGFQKLEVEPSEIRSQDELSALEVSNGAPLTGSNDQVTAALMKVNDWEETPNDCDEILIGSRVAGKADGGSDTTNGCVVVIGDLPPPTGGGVPGDGPSAPGDNPGGEGGSGSGSGPGATLPPGVAPADTPAQINCFARAYAAWDRADKVCNSHANAPLCREWNMSLYVESLQYCKTL